MAANSGSSLSSIAYYGRLGIIYLTLGLLIMIIGRSFLVSAYKTYKRLYPDPPPPPTMGFGALPYPAFPRQLSTERPREFVLETIGQQFPSYGPTVPVYFMPINQPNLLALDVAKERAAALGFVFPPEKITNDLYRWRRTQPIPATLELDIVQNTADLQVDWPSSLTLLDQKMIPDPQSLQVEARTLLRNADLMHDDIATTSPQITYFQALAGELRRVESVSEADFVQVDIYRHTPQNLPAVTAQLNHGVIRILFSGSRQQGERVLRLISNYYPVDFSVRETYPLQPASAAWETLRSGGGYIVARPAGKDKVVIRNISLAYYEPVGPQNYYQPVYVFDGDDGFRALVPALVPQVYN